MEPTASPTPVPVTVVQEPKKYPAIVEQWVNLFHTIGLPWTIVIVGVWQVVPTGIKAQRTLDELNEHAKVAIPVMNEAIPILRELKQATIKNGLRNEFRAEQRHSDLGRITPADNDADSPN